MSEERLVVVAEKEEEFEREQERRLAQVGLELEFHISASRQQRRRKSLLTTDPDRIEVSGRKKQDALDEYNTLLSGLSGLSAQHDDEEQLHLVYSLAIESVTTEEEVKLLAEALHQRWLSDPAFPPVAAKLALFFADLEIDDLKFGSMVLSMVMNDWKDRLEMRRTSHTIFANSVHFCFQFYFAFRHRGPIFKALIEPLFDYLHMLVDKEAGDGELLLLHRLFCTFGADISALHFRETQAILIKVRHKIIDGELKQRIRGKLLEVIDLSYSQFEFSALSEEQQNFYLRYHVRRAGSASDSEKEDEGPRGRRRLRYTPRPSARRESIIF